MSIIKAFGGHSFALIGAVAANQYMPSRATGDIDFAIAKDDQAEVTASLQRAGWKRGRALDLRPPLTGWAWTMEDGREVDVICVPGQWGRELVTQAANGVIDGLPAASLPHLIVLKLFAARATDAGDISRMLGHQSDAALNAVRKFVKRILRNEQDMEDLEQLIELGKLEYGPM